MWWRHAPSLRAGGRVACGKFEGHGLQSLGYSSSALATRASQNQLHRHPRPPSCALGGVVVCWGLQVRTCAALSGVWGPGTGLILFVFSCCSHPFLSSLHLLCTDWYYLRGTGVATKDAGPTFITFNLVILRSESPACWPCKTQGLHAGLCTLQFNLDIPRAAPQSLTPRPRLNLTALWSIS